MNIKNLKFGGMIAENYDKKLISKRSLKKNELSFSHGRSAMIWLVRNNNFKNCLLCNYTWPAIPELMKKLNLKVDFYDLFEKNIINKLNRNNGETLLIVPIFYGFKPWINYIALGQKINRNVHILLDGAQTAFAHNQYILPKYGSILSCPHKSLGINDGAILKISNLSLSQLKDYNSLKRENEFLKIKKISRKLLNSGDKLLENKGLRLSKKLEETWASIPEKKISIESLNKLKFINQQFHIKERIKKFNFLKKHFEKYRILPNNLELGCPFGFPILHKKRDKLIELLHRERVYATSLWSKNKYVTNKFKNSKLYSKQFLALPLDQRYNIDDLNEMVRRVKIALDILN
tara:strand:- start:2274 stop:3317 length:1044 start_codon:yes stop_codon:yes gene_type:complete